MLLELRWITQAFWRQPNSFQESWEPLSRTGERQLEWKCLRDCKIKKPKTTKIKTFHIFGTSLSSRFSCSGSRFAKWLLERHRSQNLTKSIRFKVTTLLFCLTSQLFETVPWGLRNTRCYKRLFLLMFFNKIEGWHGYSQGKTLPQEIAIVGALLALKLKGVSQGKRGF